MTPQPVFRDGTLHVMREMCSTCIFRPGNKMHLNRGRVRDMVEACVADQGHIPCHTTYENPGVSSPHAAVCRGFYDSKWGEQIAAIQLARKLGLITEQEEA